MAACIAVTECYVVKLVDILHVVDCEAFFEFDWKFLHILSVTKRQHDSRYVVVLTRSEFLSDTANTNNFTQSSDFSSHRQVCSHRLSSCRWYQRREQRNSCWWSIFWSCPHWHVEMVRILVKFFSKTVLMQKVKNCNLDNFNTFRKYFSQSSSCGECSICFFLTLLLLFMVFIPFYKLNLHNHSVAIVDIGQTIWRPNRQLLVNVIKVVVIGWRDVQESLQVLGVDLILYFIC